MLQGDAMNRNAAILIYKGMKFLIHKMEDYLVPDVRIVGSHQEVEQFAHLLRSVYVQLCCSPQQVHRAYQPGQTENMVTMIVANEDVSDIGHREPHQLHLCLSSFAAVYHEKLAPHIQYLRGRLVTSGGFCRATTQDIQFKVHSSQFKVHR